MGGRDRLGDSQFQVLVKFVEGEDERRENAVLELRPKSTLYKNFKKGFKVFACYS